MEKKIQKRNTSHRYMRFSPFPLYILPQPRASRDIYISNLENLLATYYLVCACFSFDLSQCHCHEENKRQDSKESLVVWHEIKCTQKGQQQTICYAIRGNCRVYITMPRMDSIWNVTIHLKYIFSLLFRDLFNLIKSFISSFHFMGEKKHENIL